MLYLKHGVCVGTYLPQNGFKCVVHLGSPLRERILTSILAWHFNHLFLRLEGHERHLVQLSDLVQARFVPYSVFKCEFSFVLQDVH